MVLVTFTEEILNGKLNFCAADFEAVYVLKNLFENISRKI